MGFFYSLNVRSHSKLGGDFREHWFASLYSTDLFIGLGDMNE